MSADRNVANENKKKKSLFARIILAILKVLAVAVETVLLVAAVLYAVMFLLTKGPSKSARDLFVLSVRETSAIGFLADWFLTADEIAQIEASKNEEMYYAPTDTSLITINTASEPNPETGPQADAWGLVDEDGDGIILEEIHGKGYSGFMMVVLDPSRVIMGCVPESLGRRGYTVAEMAKHYDAVAAINAGGFEDK